MSRKRKNGSLDEAKGDMTSMIDVVFLLLIFFIVMPFKSPEARIQSHLPKTGSNKKNENKEDVEKIDIKIKRNGMAISPSNHGGVEIKINGRKIIFRELEGHLASIKQKVRGDLTKVPVELNADEDVPFVYVMNALDSAKLTGFTLIKFPKPPVTTSGRKTRKNN